jgi:hypothetical protein
MKAISPAARRADQFVADPAIGREAPLFSTLIVPRSEKIICAAPGSSKGLPSGRHRCSAVSCQMRRHSDDQEIELVVRLVVIVGIDQAQVDRRMAAIGDDREQDVVAGLGRPVALLDRLDAGVERVCW